LFALQGADAQTLQGALDEAHRNNPQLAAQRAHLGAAHAQVDESRAGWLPHIQLRGSAGAQQVDTALAAEMGGASMTRSLNPQTLSLSVEQSLYDGGKTAASVRRANNAVEAAQAQLHQAEQTLYLEAATAYLDVLTQQTLLGLEQDNVAMLSRQLEATRLREAAGELTPTDIYQAEARLAQARARQRRAEATLASARAAYRRHIGSEAEGLTPPPSLTGLPASLDEARRLAEGENPQLTQARYALDASRNDVEATRALGRPSLTLSGALLHSTEESIFSDRTDTQQIMLSASVPIYAGGADTARTRQAQQQLLQQQAQLQAARDRIELEVTSAWETWQAAKSELEALHEQQHASEAALAGVSAEQQAGSRSVLDVLNAQQELLNAQLGVAGAQRALQVAGFRLLAATGGLTSAALGVAVASRD